MFVTLTILSACSFAQVPGVNHVVIIFSENQSGDHLGPLMPSGFDTVSSGNTKTGTVPLVHGVDPPLANCGHGYSQATTDIDGGKMDGFASGCATIDGVNQAYTQLYCVDLPWFCSLANNQLAGLPTRTADHFFESTHDPSWGSHLFMIAATDANVIGIPNNHIWGCDAPVGTTVAWKDPSTGKNSLIFPCVHVPTIADRADAAQVSLNYYGAPLADKGYRFVSPDYVDTWRNGADWSYVKDINNFAADVAAGTLAQITILTPPMASSGHPLYSMAANEAWIKMNLEALQASPEWSSTAVFVTWDDWGGWYDHVAPPAGDGLRVPLVVVSPLLTNPGVVYHSIADFGSVLRFAAKQFGMKCLTTKDCNAPALSGMFQRRGK